MMHQPIDERSTPAWIQPLTNEEAGRICGGAGVWGDPHLAGGPETSLIIVVCAK